MLLHQRVVRKIGLRRAGDETHPHFRAPDHEGVPHVVPRVAHIHQFLAFERPEMLSDRQEIGENLRGVVFVGQPVPNGNARVLCQRFHDLLPVAAIFDAVEHPPQNARGIGNAFFLADLRTFPMMVAS